MKRLLVFIALTITCTIGYGQKSIDDLFDRYAGKDGFTTVTINGSLLKLASCFGDHNDDNSVPADITQIRILSQENTNMTVENFYKLVIKDIDLNNYEEFMRIKESDQDLRMLVRTEGKEFKEFLLISGGKDNAIIQIKGHMTFEDAKKFSDDAKKDQDKHITAKNK